MTQWWIVYCPGKKVARSSRSAGLKEELTKFPWIYAGTSFKVQIDHAYYLKYTCYMCYVDMVAILFQMDGKGA